MAFGPSPFGGGPFACNVSRIFQVLQQSFDVSRAVQHREDCEWRARGIVDDKIGVDAPELHRPGGEVFSLVTDFRRGGELLEGVLQRFEDPNRSIDAVIGDERANIVDIRLASGVRW